MHCLPSQAGVVAEQSLEALVGFLLAAEVLADAEEAGRAIPHALPDAGLHGQQQAVMACQRQRTLLLLAPDHGRKNVLGLPPQRRRIQIRQMHRREFGDRVSQRVRDGGVGVDDPAVESSHHDHVRHRLEETAEVGLDFALRCGGGFLGADVPAGTD